MESPLHANASRRARLEAEVGGIDGRVALVIAMCFIGITLIQVLA